MKNRESSSLGQGMAWLTLFAVWTWLVQIVDVQRIGPDGSEVGFAALNGWFHRLTGVHMTLYHVTDWLGFVPVFICILFGIMGCRQLAMRRSLVKVDADILFLGVYYAVGIAAYLAFEMIPINFRPLLIEGRLEASYPSSTTLLVLSVMPTLAFQIDRRWKSKAGCKAVRMVAVAFSAFMVIGRLISGVHWMTDIVGSALLSRGMFCVYRTAVIWLDQRGHGGA